MNPRLLKSSLRLAGMAAFALLAWPAPAAEPVPQWIWAEGEREGAQKAAVASHFDVRSGIKSAHLRVIGDFAGVNVFLNGRLAGAVPAFSPLADLDVKPLLRPKGNELLIQAEGVPGPSAVAIKLELKFTDGTTGTMASDTSWSAVPPDNPGGPRTKAASFGSLDAHPWGDQVGDVAITPLDNYEQWRLASGAGQSASASAFRLLPGFTIDLVRSAAADEDSWISMAFDARGRVILAKEKKGLLRMTLAADGKSAARVEAINDDLPEVRGLVFAHGALYANANDHNLKPRTLENGLYRLRDTDGDDRFDEVKHLGPATRTGGHGRNDVTVGPDGWIYQMHGDSVSVPPGARLLPSPVADLNPGDNRTHGHLIRADASGERWEVVAHGLRNPFGIAFNTDGEAFTYDADAEHDMGAPWYRPTRVRHLVSGADYGWRNVTGAWPPYYPDHIDEPPNTLDIGKGSPTAVEFGTRSRFPPAWRRALFVMDWAYGRIFAVHFAPQGASYVGRAETFLRGTPANVTDMDFGPDGALYFVTGGRGTQSGLYRVRYTGPEVKETAPTPQQLAREAWSAKARQLRRQLESFHGRRDPAAIEAAWPHLDNADPWIRHAARIALEHQPPGDWQGRALAESHPPRALAALLALARAGRGGAHERILQRLVQIPFDKLGEEAALVAIRTVEICLQRIERPDPRLAAPVVQRLDRLFPDGSMVVNRELARLLAALGATGVVPRTMTLLDRAASQEERMHFLFVLRNVRDGWTPEARRRYFVELANMERYRGGAGLPKFIEQIRGEALAAVPANERAAMEALVAANRGAPAGDEPIQPRPFVRRWTVAELADAWSGASGGGGGRDFERGRAMFKAAMCGRCHQVGVEGRAFGPDLTNVSSRLSRRDLIEAIVEPSKFVAENFRNLVVTTKNGESFTGQIVLEGDYRTQVLRLATDPLHPFQVAEIPKNDIVSHRESDVSPMPEGLLDSFTKEEILDLLAWLEAGGSSAHPAFQ